MLVIWIALFLLISCASLYRDIGQSNSGDQVSEAHPMEPSGLKQQSSAVAGCSFVLDDDHKSDDSCEFTVKFPEWYCLIYACDYDIIFVTEIALSSQIPSSMFDPHDGFSVIRCDRQSGGGVCCII